MLSLFAMCDRFHCLPNKGGWYDQSPEICRGFSIIHSIVSDEENKRNKKPKTT